MEYISSESNHLTPGWNAETFHFVVPSYSPLHKISKYPASYFPVFWSQTQQIYVKAFQIISASIEWAHNLNALFIIFFFFPLSDCSEDFTITRKWCIPVCFGYRPFGGISPHFSEWIMEHRDHYTEALK